MVSTQRKYNKSLSEHKPSKLKLTMKKTQQSLRYTITWYFYSTTMAVTNALVLQKIYCYFGIHVD